MRFITLGLEALVVLSLLPGCSSTDPGTGTSELVVQEEEPIIGGIVDKRRAYVVGVGDNQGAFCTGTVISRRTVLTAGHCYGGITKVYFGIDLTQIPQSVNVVQEVRHPKYDDQTI